MGRPRVVGLGTLDYCVRLCQCGCEGSLERSWCVCVSSCRHNEVWMALVCAGDQRHHYITSAGPHSENEV